MHSSLESIIAPIGNEATRIVSDNWLRGASQTFEEAFVENYATIKGIYDGCESPSALLTIFDANNQIITVARMSMVKEAQMMLTIGRHSSVDVCLGDDPAVALRHCVIHVTRDQDGHIEAALYDLWTHLGVYVEGAGYCQAIKSDGDICFRVGAYRAMLFVRDATATEWPDGGPEAWSTRPPFHVVDKRDRGDGASRDLDDGRARPMRRERLPTLDAPIEVTHIRVFDGPLAGRELGCLGHVGADTTHALEIEGPAGREQVALNSEKLTRGVLIGRYERCHVRSGALEGATAVSRVHVLVLRTQGGIVAYDVGSTYGSSVSGEPGRLFDFSPGTVIELAGQASVRISRVENGQIVRPVAPINWGQN